MQSGRDGVLSLSHHGGAASRGVSVPVFSFTVLGGTIIGGTTGGLGGTTIAHPPPPHPPHPPPPPHPEGLAIRIEFVQGVTAELVAHEVTISEAVLVPVEV